MPKVNKTYNIDETLVQLVEEYSKQSGIFKSKIVEFALQEYLEKRNVYSRSKVV